MKIVGRPIGYKVSEETKRKVSLSNKGHLPWSTGKHHSLETKIKMSNSAKGKLKSNETKKRMSISKKDKYTGEDSWCWKGGKSIEFMKKQATRTKPEQCEVYGALGDICFDHNHNTGKFRGWICRRCNVAIGMVKDNSETLIALAEYLKKN